MSTPNYAKLVEQGRAKGIGVPWSEDELKAIVTIAKAKGYDSLRPAAGFVRRGARTVEDVDRIEKSDADVQKKTGSKPIAALPKEELLERAKEARPSITNDASRESLEEVVTEAEAKVEAPKSKARDDKKK
jgi:hypothetical protein